MQNITFSAKDDLIAQARELARARGTTLNEEFRQWLGSFVQQQGLDVQQARMRNLLDQITTPAPVQRNIPMDLQFTPQAQRVPARDAMSEREKRMLDRLN